jgi:RNA polymerase primary sigma factor
LDAPIGDEDSSEFNELVGDERVRTPYDEINDRQLKLEIEKHLGELDERERTILTYRFGLRGASVETLETVGERFDITRERVRQIQNAAVVKLRERLFADDEPDVAQMGARRAAEQEARSARQKRPTSRPKPQRLAGASGANGGRTERGPRAREETAT